MSKKLAAGADAIVLDVKCGHGAFMETLENAQALSRLMVDIGHHAGRQVTALITQMEQPLGRAVGHALEVKEAIATLQGNGPADFQELVETVAAEMLHLGHGAASPAAARQQIRTVIETGAALAKFRAFVAAQGGDVALVDDPERLPTAPVCQPYVAPQSGYIARIDAREVGLTCVEMGGGRQKKGDPIDHRVGILVNAKVGAQVTAGDALGLVFAADERAAQHAITRLQHAYTFSAQPVPPLPIVYDRITTA